MRTVVREGNRSVSYVSNRSGWPASISRLAGSSSSWILAMSITT